MDLERIIGAFHCESYWTMPSWGVSSFGLASFFGYGYDVECGPNCNIVQTIIYRMGGYGFPFYDFNTGAAVRGMEDIVTLYGNSDNRYSCTTTGICITDGSVVGGVKCDTIRWTGCEEEYSYNIYRSDNCWGPSALLGTILRWDTRYTTDGLHYVYIDSSVAYSRPYLYFVEAPGMDAWGGFGTPLNLPQPTLPARPTGLVASNPPLDCGNNVSLSWQASAGADSYYVFRSRSGNLTDCSVMHDFVGRTAGPSYEDNSVLPGDLCSYAIVARNESGSSESSEPDTVIAVRELEGLSVTQSQVSVINDSIMVCPGGDGNSLAIDLTLLNVCGEPIVGEPPSSLYGVLVRSEGNVTLCFGDTLRPLSDTDFLGRTQMTAHHTAGCGIANVCIYARGQALAQQPSVVFRGPDLNANGTVNTSDYALWACGGECTDLNWDGTEGELADRIIFNSHWQHTSSPTIVVNAPNGSEWWKAGDEKEITWQFAPTAMKNAYDAVDLFLSTDGGVSYPELIGSVSPNSGSYLWSVRQGLSSGDCKVKAVARDSHGCSVPDASDGCFSVAAVKSGLVSVDATWASPVTVVGDVTVAEGARLSLSPGAAVRFETSDALYGGQDPGKCELIVMGGIGVRGSQSKPVEFSSVSASPRAGDWRGIRLSPTSSSDSLDNCVIRHAYIGIEACTTTVTVDSCSVSDFSVDGIKAKGSTVTITSNTISIDSTAFTGIELVNSSGSACHNIVAASPPGSGYGVQCSGTSSVLVSHNKFQDLYVGIKGYGTSQLEIADNLLTNSSSQGIIAEGSCQMTARRNRISDYTYYGVTVKNSAHVDLWAEPDSGLNSIPKGAPSNSYCVLNKTAVTVKAEDNWWGTDVPLPNFFYGPVDWVPFLTGDPGLQFAVTMPGQILVVPATAYTVQNYPNPLNPMTSIEYGVPEDGMLVTVKVFDISGRLVRTLVDAREAAGVHTVSWDGCSEDGRRVASGVYLYETVIGEYRVSKKMVVLR